MHNNLSSTVYLVSIKPIFVGFQLQLFDFPRQVPVFSLLASQKADGRPALQSWKNLRAKKIFYKCLQGNPYQEPACGRFNGVRLAVYEFGVVAIVADFQTDVYCRCVFCAEMEKRIGETVLLDIRLQFAFGQLAQEGEQRYEVGFTGAICANQYVDWPHGQIQRRD